MAISVYHMIKQDGGASAPSVTICGQRGLWLGAGNAYATPTGAFFAVLASNPTQGATCAKCRSILNAIRGRGEENNRHLIAR